MTEDTRTGTSIEDDVRIGSAVRESVLRMQDPVTEETAFGDTEKVYSKGRLARVRFLLICIVAAFLVFGISIAVGSKGISFVDVYRIIYDHLIGNIMDPTADYVVWDLRLPRILGALFAGAGLAVCGVVMQNILRNPMADPYTTGVSSGASLGATLMMTAFSGVMVSTYSVIIGAFVFSLIPILLMIALSIGTRSSPTSMIMAGIGVMFILNAVTTLLMLWTDPQQLAAIYKWQVGTLDMITWETLPVMVGVAVLGVVISSLISGKLNILAAGDDNAKAMGVDAGRMRLVCMLLVGLISAGIVSFTGLLGFVGLV